MCRSINLIVGLILACSFYCGATDVFVAVNGNDLNPGTKERPFASIVRAQHEVRKIKVSVNVYLRAGTYYLKRPVIFGLIDSREKDQAVTYKAYRGEKVVISSALNLKLRWHEYKNGIMQAVVNQPAVFDELFVNNQLQHMARYPNYDANIAHYAGFAADAISAEKIKKWRNPTGGYIHGLHQSEWGDFSYLITGKDSMGNIKMEGGYQNNRPSGMHKMFRFVENIKEELDVPGEWFFDKERHILYLYPNKGINLNNSTVQVPQLESLIEFKGTVAAPVKNISLEGLEFTQTLRTFMKNKEPLLRGDWTIYRKGAITMVGTEYCAVKFCYFNTVGGNAVVFSNYNRHNEIMGSRITDAGSSGVVFVGDPSTVRSALFRYEQSNSEEKIDTIAGPKGTNYPSDCLVEDNLIEGIGRVEKQVAGVEISMAMNITVSHNTISRVPRAGININDGNWGGHLIEFNDVFNTVLETGDHGAFNSWGRDRFWHPNRKMMDSLVAARPGLVLLDMVRPIVIRNNRFRCDHGWDIDLDDGSSNYEIYNNVLLNGGLKLREGFYRKVYNNILINNSFHPHVWFKNSHDIFERNIVSSAYFPIGIIDWGKNIDHNLFPDVLSLSGVQNNGTDLHSVSGDAMFRNTSTADYSVRAGSPAFKVGFQNFTMDSFGVVSPKLKAIAQKVNIPVMLAGIKAGSQQTYEFMGARVKDLNTLGERSATGMESETGVLVLEVPKASILYGKLYANDVILKFDGSVVSNMKDLLSAKMGLQLVHYATLDVFRNQALKQIEIALK